MDDVAAVMGLHDSDDDDADPTPASVPGGHHVEAAPPSPGLDGGVAGPSALPSASPAGDGPGARHGGDGVGVRSDGDLGGGLPEVGAPVPLPLPGGHGPLLRAAPAPRNADGNTSEWPIVATVYTLDGSQLCGYIKHSATKQQMSAWCVWCDPKRPAVLPARTWGTHGDCRTTRNTFRDPDQKYEFRGRPLSYLVAWLQMAPSVCDHDSHMHVGKSIDKALRVKTRNWMLANGGSFGSALAAERPLRDDEPFEWDKNP